MIRDYSDLGNHSNVLVYVTSSKGGEVASKLIGRFVVNELEFRFTAIAFGRIGGHNIHLRLSKRTINTLRKNGHDPDALLLELQRKLIEGDIIVANDSVKDGYST